MQGIHDDSTPAMRALLLTELFLFLLTSISASTFASASVTSTFWWLVGDKGR